jgi:hypothetical protein
MYVELQRRARHGWLFEASYSVQTENLSHCIAWCVFADGGVQLHFDC